jgi:hypothetical protein
MEDWVMVRNHPSAFLLEELSETRLQRGDTETAGPTIIPAVTGQTAKILKLLGSDKESQRKRRAYEVQSCTTVSDSF